MVTDRSCNNKLVTTELVVQCRKSQVTYGVTGMKNKNVKCVQKIKCVKVRALFPQNKVRSARAEQLWLILCLCGFSDGRLLSAGDVLRQLQSGFCRQTTRSGRGPISAVRTHATRSMCSTQLRACRLHGRRQGRSGRHVFRPTRWLPVRRIPSQSSSTVSRGSYSIPPDRLRLRARYVKG